MNGSATFGKNGNFIVIIRCIYVANEKSQ